MKALYFFLLSVVSLSAMAADLDKRTATALEYISQGYIQYGCAELQKSANVNNLAAQFYMAVCYEQGIVVEKNDANAFKMYRKSAERGLPDAMYHLALFYREGRVVTKDAAKEQEWLQRYNQKGGKFIYPDFFAIYEEGLKHQENYTHNPVMGGNVNANVSGRNKGGGRQHSSLHAAPRTIPQPKDTQIRPSSPPLVSKKSDVDQNIPLAKKQQSNTFALIIANENYQDVAKVPNALNDGMMFGQYCEKTLGIPRNNIHIQKDATLNNIKRQLHWLKQVMEAYQGQASIIFYYAGHGIPDESNGSAFLLPVDGFGTDTSTGYSLESLYAELNNKPAKSAVVFLDACFSGSSRGDGMLASARGVAIKSKPTQVKGNIVVFSAAQGDETAYPYKEKEHGLFTYFLLKKLQETEGNCSLSDLGDYLKQQVSRSSIIINGKSQTPTVTASPALGSQWKKVKLISD